jgi:nicotinamidase-related amidase
MPALERTASLLLIIDLQERLMPSIEGGAAAVANARRLVQAAETLRVPIVFTEENTAGLGRTVGELADYAAHRVFHKMSFNACRETGFLDRLDDRAQIVVAGCETHVCVLQTVLGLIGAGRQVYLVRDAAGSRIAESKEAALARMAAHGVEIVTTEMVFFEWLRTADDPRFRQLLALIKEKQA